MSDTFETIKNKYGNTPTAIVLFVASVAMLVIGINHLAEDTYSSYLGLKWLEAAFGMNVQIFDWTYWTMSFAPQVASIVFFFVYLSDTDKKWALFMTLFTQFIDFCADVWYRSNGNVSFGEASTWASAAITFAFFTIGSEFFVTFGFGLVLKLYAPALAQWNIFSKNVKTAKSGGSAQPQKYKAKHKPSHLGQPKPAQRPKMTSFRPKSQPFKPAPLREPIYMNLQGEDEE